MGDLGLILLGVGVILGLAGSKGLSFLFDSGLLLFFEHFFAHLGTLQVVQVLLEFDQLAHLSHNGFFDQLMVVPVL